jgi:hypothetical protein
MRYRQVRERVLATPAAARKQRPPPNPVDARKQPDKTPRGTRLTPSAQQPAARQERAYVQVANYL